MQSIDVLSARCLTAQAIESSDRGDLRHHDAHTTSLHRGGLKVEAKI